MEEKAGFNSFDENDFALTPSRVLELDNEGLDLRLQRGMSNEGEELDTYDGERENHFDETAVLNHNLLHSRGHLAKEPSNRTVSSLSSFGENQAPFFGLEKNVSGRSAQSSSKSIDPGDENSHGISLTPRTSRNLAKEQSTRSFMDRSPRARRRANMNSSRRSMLSSTHEEEAIALSELYVIVGEEHRDKVEIKKSPAGFITNLVISHADIDGPLPECICVFTQLTVLIVEHSNLTGTIPLWLDGLANLQEINLTGNHLAGTLSEGLADLKNLSELILCENQLQGSIPDAIGELVHLTRLELRNNDITGPIPESICNLSALSDLNLSSCYLSGHIPVHIGRLHSLSTLLLHSNHLVGSIPDSIGDLLMLEELNLSNNHLKGHLPETVGKLHMLSTLNVLHNELTGNIPASIGDLSSLTTLTLSSNHFRGPIPESIFGLSMLSVLSLTKNQLTGQIPSGIDRLTNLTRLNLSYNRFKGCIPESIGNLGKLAELHLDHNALSGSLPQGLGFLTELTTLTITQNQLSGEIPQSVGNLSLLTTIHLSHNQLTGCIPESIGMLTALQTIHLCHNQLTGPIPEGIVNLVALCDLDLSFNRLSGSIPDGIVNLPSLVEVNLVDTYLSGYDLKKGVFLMSSCGIWATDQYGQRGISVVHFEDWSPSFYQSAPLMHKEHHKFQIPLSLISLFPHTLFLFPPELLNRIFLDASFYTHIRSALFLFLKKVCEAQNPCILQCLVVLWYLLDSAAKVHISEEADLLHFADEIVKITNELFKCTSMDKLKNVQRLILEPQYCQPIQKNIDGTFDSVTYWNMAHIFADNSPIQFCLEHNHKFVLALTQITNITDQLFWGCVNTIPNCGDEDPRTSFEFSNVEFHSLTIYKLFACPRYTPAVMFFIEGVAKLYTLILVSLVCTYTYGALNNDRYSGSLEENGLLIMLAAHISYEMGQLASCGWDLHDYFNGVWNMLDVASCFLLLLWAISLPFPQYFVYGKSAVALSAIPLAVLQLQYLSLIKTLGLLVLMIQSMMVDVSTFIVVYLVSIYGFTVCFRALFYTVNDYSSTGITFVTLFQSTLGNFNFDNFDGTFKMLGIVVMVLFLTLTNVLLVNLLIAQMSSTYNRIIYKSREEWTFIKASYVQDNMLLDENNPFCMLPPPMNLVTIGLYPFHVWALDHLKISVCGTAADYMLSIYLMAPRFLFFWWKCVDTAFIDLDDEDEDFQEQYHAIIKCLIYLLGRKLARMLIFILGMPFGFLYVLISTVLRLFYVVVRVKEPDEDGNYEINFYLEGDDDDGSQDGGGDSKALVASPGKSQKSGKSGKSDKGDGESGKGQGPDGAYTFADAKPDAFAAVPDDHPDAEPPKAKPESKGAKRIKKALIAKQSFIIDPEIYNDPASLSAAQGNAKRTINKSPSTKLTAKLSFNNNDGKTATANTTPNGVIAPRMSFTLNDGSAGPGSGPPGTKKISPKTSFNLSDGFSSIVKKVSPKTSFNLNDGNAGGKIMGAKSSSFTDNDGDTAKVTSKLSFSSIDGLLGLGPTKRTPRLSDTSDIAEYDSSPPHGDKDKAGLVNASVKAAKYANKMMHKVGHHLHSSSGGEEPPLLHAHERSKSSDFDSEIEATFDVHGHAVEHAHTSHHTETHTETHTENKVHHMKHSVNVVKFANKLLHKVGRHHHSHPHHSGGTPPGEEAAQISARNSPQLEEGSPVTRDSTQLLKNSVNAVKFANRMIHTLKPAATAAAVDALNRSESEDPNTDYDDDGVRVQRKPKELNPLAMFGMGKVRSRRQTGDNTFHPDAVEFDEQERAAPGSSGKSGGSATNRERTHSGGAGAGAISAFGSTRSNSGGGAGLAGLKKKSRRLSKQESTSSKRSYRGSNAGMGQGQQGLDYSEDGSQALGTPRDDEDYRLEEGDEYDFDDEEYISDEEPQEEVEDEVVVLNTPKIHVLFTPDDIIRMFPANESEMAKLEIEDEIRKLKVSSEAAVTAATEEMKADFKNKINQAVAEIRLLKDVLLLNTRPGTGRKDSFSIPEASPLGSSRKTPSPIDGKPPMRRKESAQFQSLALPLGSLPTVARSMYNLHGVEGSVGTRALSPMTRLPAAATPVIAATPPVVPPVVAPAPPAAPASPAEPSEEVLQLQKEMEALKGDMKDIKKLLGNILVKMK